MLTSNQARVRTVFQQLYCAKLFTSRELKNMTVSQSLAESGSAGFRLRPQQRNFGLPSRLLPCLLLTPLCSWGDGRVVLPSERMSRDALGLPATSPSRCLSILLVPCPSPPKEESLCPLGEVSLLRLCPGSLYIKDTSRWAEGSSLTALDLY